MKMRDIDFLIIGATKSATTWLQQSLQQHPSVYMPDPELHYFSRAYEQGESWYLSQFKQTDRSVKGEKSNSYMDTPDACRRIRADLPEAKLIAQLRNPIERAYSDYCMLYRRGEVGPEIAQYLDPRVADGGRFLKGGLYYDQLREYMDMFPSAQLLVLLYENILTAPKKQLQTVAAFLGLDDELDLPPVTSRVKDKTQSFIDPQLRRVLAPFKSGVRPFRETALFRGARDLIAKELRYPPMNSDLRMRLVDYYAPQVEKLERIGDHAFSSWLHDVSVSR